MVIMDVCKVNIDLDSDAKSYTLIKGVVHEYHQLDKLDFSNPQLVISVDAKVTKSLFVRIDLRYQHIVK